MNKFYETQQVKLVSLNLKKRFVFKITPVTLRSILAKSVFYRENLPKQSVLNNI